MLIEEVLRALITAANPFASRCSSESVLAIEVRSADVIALRRALTQAAAALAESEAQEREPAGWINPKPKHPEDHFSYFEHDGWVPVYK